MSAVGAAVFVVATVAAGGAGPWWATCRIGRMVRPRPRPRGRAAAARRAEALCAVELLAACLAAGASPVRAAEAAGQVLDGPAGEALRAAARAAGDGVGPERCWAKLAAVPELDGAGRILARAAVCGTRAVGAMNTEAAGLRQGNKLAAQAALARVGVWSVAPLALCFLPAFLCLGVVPIALGLAPALPR